MLRIIVYLLIIICLVGCNSQPTISQQQNVVAYIGEKEPVSRASVAKMLALSLYTQEEIDNLERIITFDDTDISLWYDKYINAVFTAKLMAGVDDNNFAPEDSLTLIQANALIKKVNSKGNFELKYSEYDKDKPISYKMWTEAYTKAVEGRITVCNIFVYATKNECEDLGDNYILCNGGLRKCSGVDMTPYTDKMINVAMKGTEIIAVINVTDNFPTLKNVEILESDSNNIVIDLKEATRKFKVDNKENLFKIGDKVDVKFSASNDYTITKAIKE